MAEDFPIEHEDDGTRGRYVIHLPDGSEAELTYRRQDAGTIVVNHTGVPPQYRSNGLALKLVEAAVDDARRNGGKILPVCPYVVAQFRRHPEWADLHA